MGLLIQIDHTMPLSFFGCVNETITDPEMVTLAKQMNMPRMLLCDVPLKDAAQDVEDPETVEQILSWIQASEKWRSITESTLQCMSERDGRALLTAFMPMEDFVALGEDLMADPQFASLQLPFAQWQAMGASTGYIDGYRLE